MWNCLWGNALKRSPGIIRKSRVSYPVPGFLSSATWPSLPKKHYNGLNQTKLNLTYFPPGVAKVALDRCMTPSKHSPEDEDFYVMFSYEFIDDTFLLKHWESNSDEYKTEPGRSATRLCANIIRLLSIKAVDL